MAPGWRTAPLPGDWPVRRRMVLERDDYVCRLGYAGCQGVATEVDHIGDPADHRLVMLQSVCRVCHGVKTGRQGAAAANARRGSRRRPAEPHPGRLDHEL